MLFLQSFVKIMFCSQQYSKILIRNLEKNKFHTFSKLCFNILLTGTSSSQNSVIIARIYSFSKRKKKLMQKLIRLLSFKKNHFTTCLEIYPSFLSFKKCSLTFYYFFYCNLFYSTLFYCNFFIAMYFIAIFSVRFS